MQVALLNTNWGDYRQTESQQTKQSLAFDEWGKQEKLGKNSQNRV